MPMNFTRAFLTGSTNGRTKKESYSAKPYGDEIAISKELYQKWLPVMTEFATIAKNVKATDENGAADISGSKEKK